MDLGGEAWSAIGRAALVGLLACYFALAATLAARRRAAIQLAAISFLAIILAIWLRQWPFYGSHGYLHYSIVYELFDRGAPPRCPVFAESPLMYGWAFHYVAATLMRFVALAPPYWFLFLNLASFGAIAAVVDRLTFRISPDRGDRVYALFVSLLGFAVLASPPVSNLLQPLGFLRIQRLDPLSKFVAVNTTQLGLVFVAIGVLGILRLLESPRSARFAYLLIGVGLFGAGFFYPILWLTASVLVAVAAAVLVATHRADRWRNLVFLFSLSAAAVMVLYSWLSSLHAGRDPAFKTTIFDGASLARNLPVALCLLLVPLALALADRDGWRRLFPTARSPALFLSLAFLVCLGMFVLIEFPWVNEYKFLLAGQILLGPLMGPRIREFASRRKATVFLLLVLLALPTSAKLAPVLAIRRPLSTQTTVEGREIRSRDPAEDALYSWIRERSPADSVFLENRASIPLLGRRPLLVARGTGGRDGWGMRPPVLLTLALGVSQDLVARRQRLADGILQGGFDELPSDLVDEALATVAPADLLVVVRDRARAAELERHPRFTRVWAGEAATVLRLARVGNDHPREEGATVE